MSDFHAVVFGSGLLILLAGIRFIVSLFSPNAVTGPYDLRLKELQHCSDSTMNSKDFYLQTYRLSKLADENYTLSANITFKKLFSDDYDIQTVIGVKDFAGYRNNFRHFEMRGVCTTLKYFSPGFFRRILEVSNSTDCPIPPGSYELKDIPLEVLRPLALSKFPYGSYRTKAYIKENQRIAGCIMIFFDIVQLK